MWTKLSIHLGTEAITWIFGMQLLNAPKEAWIAVMDPFTGEIDASGKRPHLFDSMTLIWKAQVAESAHDTWIDRLH